MTGAMRLVMTLLVRDEVDVVGENLDFHFSQGVDFAIVMDNRSRDGTREALEHYERDRRIRVVNQAGVYDQAPWLTEMARMAVQEEGADWVLPNDADEFWVPRDGTLRDLLERTPPPVGAIECPRAYFAPAPEDGRPWWERMTLRQRVPVSKRGLALNSKWIHRADPGLTIGKGNHQRQEPLVGESLAEPGVVVQHFQMRTYRQFERAVIVRGSTLKGPKRPRQQFNLARRREYAMWRRGELEEYYRRYVKSAPDDEFVTDTSVRDRLRAIYEPGSAPAVPPRRDLGAAYSRGRARLGALPVRVRARAGRALRGAPVPPAPFIVGVPRSGTTLLRLMLDAHPQVAIPAETHFLPQVIRRWRESKAGGARRKELVAGAVELITEHRRYFALAVDPDRLETHLDGLWRPGLADVLRAVHVVHAREEGKSRWGDKTPGYVARMRALHSVLPEARFVHLIRDGRDVALSLASVSWGPGDAESAMRVWRRRIRSARRQAAKLPPHRYTEVRYEALVREPELVLRRVARFLDIPFDPAMLVYHERSDRRLAPAMRDMATNAGGVIAATQRTRQHALASEPPRIDRIGRWRAEMDPAELRLAEGVGGDLLEQLGYELSA